MMQDLDFTEIVDLICKEDTRYDKRAYTLSVKASTRPSRTSRRPSQPVPSSRNTYQGPNCWKE